MGYIIDAIYLIREIAKLTFIVTISPFGLVAIYLMGGR